MTRKTERNTRNAFFIAGRYLGGRSSKGSRPLVGAVLGIALSLIPIFVTLIVADGMIQGITDRFLELGTGHLQLWQRSPQRSPQRSSQRSLHPSDSLSESTMLDIIIPQIKRTASVRGVWQERQGVGIILGAAGKTGATIRAVDPSFWQDENSAKYIELISGTTETKDDSDVILGRELAEKCGVRSGDKVRLMTMIVTESGRTIPRTSVFNVAGIISSGYNELDSLWCITNFAAGSKLLDNTLYPSYLIVKINDPYAQTRPVKIALREWLASDFGVYEWKEIRSRQWASYQSTRQLLILIMAFIVLVAAINVSSATTMLVLEKQKDIAILKTCGASVSFISKVFIACGFLSGLGGVAIGAPLGLALGCFINPVIHSLEKFLSFFSMLASGAPIKILDPGFYLENIPIVLDRQLILTIIALTIIACTLASFLPARRAGRQHPLSLLRKF
jgi:lipoprotein-releasing system permease protein